MAKLRPLLVGMMCPEPDCHQIVYSYVGITATLEIGSVTVGEDSIHEETNMLVRVELDDSRIREHALSHARTVYYEQDDDQS